MEQPKTLPRGQYIFFANLTDEITATSLAQFLWDCGLDITEECVSFRTYETGHATALVSVPAEATAALINLAINGTLLAGRFPVVAEHVSRRPHVTARR